MFNFPMSVRAVKGRCQGHEEDHVFHEFLVEADGDINIFGMIGHEGLGMRDLFKDSHG